MSAPLAVLTAPSMPAKGTPAPAAAPTGIAGFGDVLTALLPQPSTPATPVPAAINPAPSPVAVPAPAGLPAPVEPAVALPTVVTAEPIDAPKSAVVPTAPEPPDGTDTEAADTLAGQAAVVLLGVLPVPAPALPPAVVPAAPPTAAPAPAVAPLPRDDQGVVVAERPQPLDHRAAPAPVAPPVAVLPQIAPAAAPPPAAAPAPVAPAPEPQPVRQPELAGALTRLRSKGDGTHEITVQLHPAELGSVHVRAVLSGDDLTVTVACADQAARQAVHSALPQLHQQLSQAGYTGLDLNLGGGQRNQDGQQHPEQPARQGHGLPAPTHTDLKAPEPDTSRRPDPDGRVDRVL